MWEWVRVGRTVQASNGGVRGGTSSVLVLSLDALPQAFQKQGRATEWQTGYRGGGWE